MRTMTLEEIKNDWDNVQRGCRDYVTQHEAEAIAKYCRGNSIAAVAKAIGVNESTILERLNTTGMAAAIGGGGQSTPPLEVSVREARTIIDRYGPKESDAEEFEPYLEFYRGQKYTDAVALRLAKAEWAAEVAVEKGIIKEGTNKREERVNRILFPTKDSDDFDIDLKSHMNKVRQAAKFIDAAKVNLLRRKSTCEKVAQANAEWTIQMERIRNFHPTFNEVV